MIRAGILVLLLTACGADGPPFKPTGNIGLSVGSDGVTKSGSIGATNGNVTMSIGL